MRQIAEPCSTGAGRAVLRLNKGLENDLAAGTHRLAPDACSTARTPTPPRSCSATARESRSSSRRRHRSPSTPFDALGVRCGPGRVDLQTRAWFNENLESRNFFVPGVHRDRRHADHAAADQHGRRARKGNRHDGADHGHADHAASSSSSARRVPFALIGFVDVLPRHR